MLWFIIYRLLDFNLQLQVFNLWLQKIYKICKKTLNSEKKKPIFNNFNKNFYNLNKKAE